MQEPVRIGEMTIDRAEIAATLEQGTKLLIWLKNGGNPIVLQNNFSREELNALTK